MLPRDLPKLRDQMIRHLDDRNSALRVGIGDDTQPALDALTLHLSRAGLYWVKADMAALAVSAGDSLDEVSWDVVGRPSAAGLICFQGGIGNVPTPDGSLPVDVLTWGSQSGHCMIWALMLRRTLLDRARLKIDAEAMPPLAPVAYYRVPFGEVTPHAELATEQEGRTLLATLAASWLLMQQPTLIDHVSDRPEKSVRQRYAREGRPIPEVTVVDLRRAYVPQDPDPGAATDGRRYNNRFVVSGHWRQQAYGPEHSLRRRQWIPSFVKGPDGAPLLVTEKVNVWRR